MAVKYILVPRCKPGIPDSPKKFYAQAKGSATVTLRKLCKEIAESSTTVSDTDVLAVLNDLTKLLKRHLENGEIVRLGDFGTFQITIGSEGVDTEAAFHSSMIRKPRVAFRPGVDLKETLAVLKYTKADASTPSIQE